MNRSSMHVHRWRSLYVILPFDELNDTAHWVLHEMIGNMKGLVAITIRGGYCESSQVEIPHGSLPFFPELRRFTTDQDVSFEHMRVNYVTLEHLCLSNVYASRRFICTAHSNFVALISLTLVWSRDWSSAGFMPLGTVTLPRLLSLTINGCCQAAMDQMDAPNLVNLHFESSYADFHGAFRCPISPVLSRVTSLVIEGYTAGSMVHNSPSPEYSLEGIYKALAQSTSLVTLRVRERAWGGNEDLKGIVEHVRKEGFPLRALKEIIIVDTHIRQPDILTENKALLTVLDPNA
jgi:hypothetical protein